LIQQLLNRWNLADYPTLERILNSMDPVAWTLVGLLIVAILLGVYFSLTTQNFFVTFDDVESTPQMLLKSLQDDPTRLSPVAIISRLGADTTLELLEYGDRRQTKEWRYLWSSVREELLHLLSQQNAFGPTYALARYYRSIDTQEPDTVRIRRTALIHKLGLRRFLAPDPHGNAAQLRIRCHPAELQGDLGFDGEVLWLMPDEPITSAPGPLIEIEPIIFRTLQDAELHLHIRRSPMVGGGFHLSLQKRHKLWIVTHEEIEWVS